ncbi:methyltransferase domain-containing protein [Streptomyces sp. NPDC049954]|uniref:methyltransferase domain-containing protein n=1 Tax=Streptomyces sp. NPDC049954 TaxID=3155779 RepID=UPI00342E6686
MSEPQRQPPATDTGPDGEAERARQARKALVDALLADGSLTPGSPWTDAFRAVPRHLFVPWYYTRSREGGYERLWGEDPDARRRERWIDGAYADAPLATRLRDGELVSSSSQPSLMARMLRDLDVHEGHRVLEIGAGTGYNAALLSHRVGDGHVTTVDLDPEITESARAHLARAGYRPHVVTGDGARGWRGDAPYDRTVVTCAIGTLPRAWLEQSAPGALVLAPLATGLLALRVRDAEHAEGRFLPIPAYFVPLRGGDQRLVPSPYLGGVPHWAARDEDFRFLLALTVGQLDPHEAMALWQRERLPGRERFGVSVRGPHQWAWLDEPDGPYAWSLP